MSTTDVRETLVAGKMTRGQTIAVSVAIFLNIVDGYDVLVMAFTSGAVAAEFDLGPGALGLLLSASLFGMAAGSLFVAPLADRVGRRPITVAALVAVTVFMAASALSTSALMLGVFRVLTGVGIGAMLPNLSTYISELASRKWREPLVTMISVGYAVGGFAGGLLAAPLIAEYGWRSAFWLGTGFGLVGLLGCLAFVPESITYLVERRPTGALERANASLRKIGRDTITELPTVEAQKRARVGDLFRGQLGRTTLLVWLAFFCVMASFYFANSWTPKLLQQSGLSEQQGILGGVLISLGGIFGALVFALVAIKVPAKFVEAGALVGGAGIFVVFSLSLADALPALITATLVGFFINATVAGMYAVVTTRYPSVVRGTGVGWGVGVGRIGAILAPTLAGGLLAAGVSERGLFYVFLVPMLIGAAAILAIGPPVDESRPAQAREPERV